METSASPALSASQIEQRQRLRSVLARLLQSAGYEAPSAVAEEKPTASDLDIGEYLSLADLDDTSDGMVLAANKPIDIVFTPEAVTMAEKGFAKGSNPAKLIVTQGLTLNQIAALSHKPKTERKDGSAAV